MTAWILSHDEDLIAVSDVRRITAGPELGGEVSVRTSDATTIPVARLNRSGSAQEQHWDEAKKIARKLAAAIDLARHQSEGKGGGMIISFNHGLQAWDMKRESAV